MSKKKIQQLEKPFPPRIVITAKNEAQKLVLKTIKENSITILAGPAGSGKTHLAVATGLQEVLRCSYRRLILTRPCVEAYGEKLGHLPGMYQDKIAPYILPIFDILLQYLDNKTITEFMKEGKIMTLPLAFMRGFTFNDAFVIGDELQNTIPQQMRMLLTRMGERCKIVITGDPSQTDISSRNGLVDAMARLKDIPGIGIVELDHSSIVRNPLVEVIDKKYNGFFVKG